MNPFQEPEVSYEDVLDRFEEASRQDNDNESSRYMQTQREWLYKNYLMRYEESLDASERAILELLLRARNLGLEITAEEAVEEFLAREDIKSALMKGESND